MLIVYSNLMVARAVIGDSPSIYNNGPGGVSYFFTIMMYRNSPIAIMNFDELHQYSPWIHVLFIISPDKPISIDDARKVLEWVSNGGEVVVMDETNSTEALLKLLGVNKSVFAGYIAMGICKVDDHAMPILFDVFKTFPEPGKAKPICWTRNSVVAFEKKIGKGSVIVIGDSSLVINYIVMDTRYGALDTYLIKRLVGNKEILIYEGNRAYRIMYSIKGVTTINAIMAMISGFPGVFFEHQGLLKIISLMILWMIITGFVSMYLFSFPRAPYPKLKKPARSEALITRKEIQRGLKDWGVETSKKK